MNKLRAKLLRLAVLLLLLPLMAACSSLLKPSTNVTEQPQREIPALPPSLSKPPSQENYLEVAQQRIEKWLQKLLDSETK